MTTYQSHFKVSELYYFLVLSNMLKELSSLRKLQIKIRRIEQNFQEWTVCGMYSYERTNYRLKTHIIFGLGL